MILEVIATTLTDALSAADGGADRLELVTGMAEGGLTPSCGLIEQVARSVQLPVQVMVRPHSQSFCYNKADMKTMLCDIRAIREIREGADYPGLGIALGCLTPDRRIDMDVLQALLNEAGDMDVTFHRAFDEVADQEAAYETLTRFPAIRRVLTSGGLPSALEAVSPLRRLVMLSRSSHVAVLAGSGLSLEALPVFCRNTGVREVHFGSGVRGPRGIADAVDSGSVRAIKQMLTGL